MEFTHVYSDKEHKRAVEIEAALEELEDTCRAQNCPAVHLERARKARLPIYEPLVPNQIESVTTAFPSQSEIGARFLEAFADREEELNGSATPAVVRLRDCAKKERSIGL